MKNAPKLSDIRTPALPKAADSFVVQVFLHTLETTPRSKGTLVGPSDIWQRVVPRLVRLHVNATGEMLLHQLRATFPEVADVPIEELVLHPALGDGTPYPSFPPLTPSVEVQSQPGMRFPYMVCVDRLQQSKTPPPSQTSGNTPPKPLTGSTVSTHGSGALAVMQKCESVEACVAPNSDNIASPSSPISPLGAAEQDAPDVCDTQVEAQQNQVAVRDVPVRTQRRVAREQELKLRKEIEAKRAKAVAEREACDLAREIQARERAKERELQRQSDMWREKIARLNGAELREMRHLQVSIQRKAANQDRLHRQEAAREALASHLDEGLERIRAAEQALPPVRVPSAKSQPGSRGLVALVEQLDTTVEAEASRVKKFLAVETVIAKVTDHDQFMEELKQKVAQRKEEMRLEHRALREKRSLEQVEFQRVTEESKAALKAQEAKTQNERIETFKLRQCEKAEVEAARLRSQMQLHEMIEQRRKEMAELLKSSGQ